ncbi:kinase-like domain-containing protein [Lactarius deliciosus]|nr:kinase-like domain-containing protein [Lactarius deliciosus]
MCPQNRQQTSEKCSTLQLDFVHVAGWYRVGKLLGSGGSGSVYLGRDIRTGTKIALKIGHADHLPSRLSHEYDVYSALGACAGVAPVHWYGKEGLYEVIVLDHLGTSLGDLIDEEQVDQSKTFQYACQMLSAIESLHTQHYIHRDIKPDNFMVQAGHPHAAVFLIDFGLARLFCNPATYLHIPYSKDHLIVRMLLFTSINGQQGHAQSRCDDLELLVYTIIFRHAVTYLGRQLLPTVIQWQSSRRKSRSRQKSCAKAYPLPSAILSPIARQQRQTTLAKHYLPPLSPLSVQAMNLFPVTRSIQSSLFNSHTDPTIQ